MPGRYLDGADACCRRASPSRAASIVALAALLLLAGCAQPGGSGTSAPRAFDTPDPYHYHCDEGCRNGLGG